MLTAAQLNHFDTFGFLLFRGLLTNREIATMTAEMYAELTLTYKNKPFDSTQRHWAPMLSDRTPFFSTLLDDDRFAGIAESILGNALPVWCDANRYTDSTTIWHPDTSASFEQAGVKFIIYLQPLTADTGALRVIPGSHRRPFYDTIKRFIEEQRPPVHEVPAVALETRPGDVIAFNINLWHAAAFASPDRHLCSLAYFPDPRSPAEESNIRDHVGLILKGASAGFDWRGCAYPSEWQQNRIQNPRRAKAIRRMKEIGIFETAAEYNRQA